MKKCVDEDSKLYRKVSASRGRWKPGASKVYPKITSEQQLFSKISLSAQNFSTAFSLSTKFKSVETFCASKVYPKITSEQQLLKGVWPPSRY